MVIFPFNDILHVDFSPSLLQKKLKKGKSFVRSTVGEKGTILRKQCDEIRTLADVHDFVAKVSRKISIIFAKNCVSFVILPNEIPRKLAIIDRISNVREYGKRHFRLNPSPCCMW